VLTTSGMPPCRPEFAVTGKDGVLQRWDASTNRLVASTSFDGTAGTALTYSRDGSSIIVGLASGEVHMLNANTLERHYTSRNTSSPIIKYAKHGAGWAPPIRMLSGGLVHAGWRLPRQGGTWRCRTTRTRSCCTSTCRTRAACGGSMLGGRGRTMVRLGVLGW
jgi:WD40 repeat protein